MIDKANWTSFASMDGGDTLATVNRLMPPWVSLLLVIFIGWQLAGIVWTLVPGSSAGDPVEVPANLPATSPTQGGTATDVDAIAANHLFGVADAEADAIAMPMTVIDDNLADTRLTNLVLKGTIASVIPEFSVAVIADGTAEQKVYAIGDSLGSGTTLHAVYADRIVLNENGALTNLRLPSDFPQASAAQIRRTTTTRQSPSGRPEQNLRNVVSANLTRLNEVVRFVPYNQDGKSVGFRVYPGRDKRQFAALGLRPQDLIKDINGQALTDPTQAMQIFESLGTASEVTVTVERGGQDQTITLRTSQLDLSGEQTQ
jgi:general secretion pathway protein C